MATVARRRKPSREDPRDDCGTAVVRIDRELGCAIRIVLRRHGGVLVQPIGFGLARVSPAGPGRLPSRVSASGAGDQVDDAD